MFVEDIANSPTEMNIYDVENIYGGDDATINDINAALTELEMLSEELNSTIDLLIGSNTYSTTNVSGDSPYVTEDFDNCAIIDEITQYAAVLAVHIMENTSGFEQNIMNFGNYEVPFAFKTVSAISSADNNADGEYSAVCNNFVFKINTGKIDKKTAVRYGGVIVGADRAGADLKKTDNNKIYNDLTGRRLT